MYCSFQVRFGYFEIILWRRLRQALAKQILDGHVKLPSEN